MPKRTSAKTTQETDLKPAEHARSCATHDPAANV